MADLTSSNSQQVLFLSAYREVTQKLVECTQAEFDSVNVQILTDLLSEREHLVASYVPSQEDRSPDKEIASLLVEVQELDAILIGRTKLLQVQTQSKLQNMQQQKRGVSAYNADYATGSAFIDRRE